MKSLLTHIAVYTLVSAPLVAQMGTQLRTVRSDLQTSEAVILTDSVRSDAFTSAHLSGERILNAGNGRWAVVRRFALLLPSTRVSLSGAVVRSQQLRMSEDALRGSRSDTSALPLASARIVDIAPSGRWTSATLEAVVAILDPSNRSVEVILERSILVSHDPVPGQQFLVLDPILAFRTKPPRMSPSRVATVAADQDWYRCEVEASGFYKFDRTYLRTAGISAELLSDIRRLRIYGLDGASVPEVLTAPRPSGMQELPRHINDANGNGALDDGESVVFYARSVRHWSYSPGTKSFQHTLNPYAERNAVIFTFDPTTTGKDLDSVASSPGPGYPVPNILERISDDRDRFNFVHSGRRWVGEPFDIADNSGVYTTMLHGLVPSTPIQYRAIFFSRSGVIDTFRVTENGDPLIGPVLMYPSDVSSVDQIFNFAHESPVQTAQHPGSLAGDRSVLKFIFGTRDQGAKGWLDWFEIFYRRSLRVMNDRLLFPSPDTTAVLEYTMTNLSSRAVLVADVSDVANVRRVSGVEFDVVADASWCRFRLPQASGSVRELAVVGVNGYLAPAAAQKIKAPWLRSVAVPVDFMIISPPEFLEEAERLRAHREGQDSLHTLVVDVTSIYNEFGGGLADPMSIRDYLAYARSNYAGTVRYVLFFGNGHFDYRNISTSERNWIPPVETAESNYQINSYTSDDFYALLDAGNARISLAIGRLPGRSLTEMRTMVDKIIRYETSSPLDPWRNRITFVADDGQTSTNPFEGSLHTAQAENLARVHTPVSFEQRKIYLVEYPTVNSASGRRKPMANEAIIDAFNRGSVALNFTGHGNPRLWTHEAVFTREGSIPRLNNRDRLTFLVAATCNFAQWDNPEEQSVGELLVTMDQGGAIAVVTATRSVYSFDSAELNYQLYNNLFRREPSGASFRMGDAFYWMKQVRFGTNDQKYHLLGDPTSRLVRPHGIATIDSVNGATTTGVVTVPSLGLVRVEGAVRDPVGTIRTDFTGSGLLELFDAKRFVSIPEWGGYSFEVQGSALYRGQVSVTAGKFSAELPVPKDVSFGNRARLALYATSGTGDAVGVTEQVTILGTDSAGAVDTTGPVISVVVGNAGFRPGDVVPVDPALIVMLSDASGINTSTAGIGHRLEAEVVNEGVVVDLGEFYRGDLDTYQSGRAVTQLTGLPEGRHVVRVRAWDIRNNSSTVEIPFDVRSGSDVDLFQVTNFPNPMTDGTQFTFQRTSSAAIDAEVRIYTVAGRLIQRLESSQIVDQFVRILWNGRDHDGSPIANGVYLYKLIVRSADRSQSREFIGKLAVVR